MRIPQEIFDGVRLRKGEVLDFQVAGWTALIAVLLALTQFRSRWLAFVMIAGLLMMGDSTPIGTAFHSVLPGFVHRLTYEDLVADPEREIRRLLDFCGLEFAPACLRHWEGGGAVMTHSSEQVRAPIFTSSVDRWRNYAPWLGELQAALR